MEASHREVSTQAGAATIAREESQQGESENKIRDEHQALIGSYPSRVCGFKFLDKISQPICIPPRFFLFVENDQAYLHSHVSLSLKMVKSIWIPM